MISHIPRQINLTNELPVPKCIICGKPVTPWTQFTPRLTKTCEGECRRTNYQRTKDRYYARVARKAKGKAA